jgi:hypothetical protein
MTINSSWGDKQQVMPHRTTGWSSASMTRIRRVLPGLLVSKLVLPCALAEPREAPDVPEAPPALDIVPMVLFIGVDHTPQGNLHNQGRQ